MAAVRLELRCLPPAGARAGSRAVHRRTAVSPESLIIAVQVNGGQTVANDTGDPFTRRSQGAELRRTRQAARNPPRRGDGEGRGRGRDAGADATDRFPMPTSGRCESPTHCRQSSVRRRAFDTPSSWSPRFFGARRRCRDRARELDRVAAARIARSPPQSRPVTFRCGPADTPARRGRDPRRRVRPHARPATAIVQTPARLRVRRLPRATHPAQRAACPGRAARPRAGRGGPREGTATLLRRLDELDRLVGDMLTLASAEAGQLIEPRPIDLRDYFDDLRRDLPLFGERDFQLETVDGKRSKLTPIGSRKCCAIWSATPSRTPSLGIAWWSQPPGSDSRLVISVSDDEPGVPPDQLDQIFERFHRLDQGRSRQSPMAAAASASRSRAPSPKHTAAASTPNPDPAKEPRSKSNCRTTDPPSSTAPPPAGRSPSRG